MAESQQLVSAVFRDRVNADAAFDWLRLNGFSDREINVLMSEQTRQTYYSGAREGKIETGNMAAQGMAVGGATGTALGATAATLAALAAVGSTLVIPGINLVLVGPIAAALAGAGAGAVTGGLIGALIGWGVPEDNAKAYHDALVHGGVVLGVRARSDDEANRIQKRFEELQGEDVFTCSC